MFEKYGERAREVVMLAGEYARSVRCPLVQRGHLMLGIAAVDGPAARLLRMKGGPDLEARVAALGYDASPLPPSSSGDFSFAPFAADALHHAVEQAQALGHRLVQPEHLLLGLIETLELDNTFEAGLLPAGVDRAAVLVAGIPGEESVLNGFHAGRRVALMYVLLRDLVSFGAMEDALDQLGGAQQFAFADEIIAAKAVQLNAILEGLPGAEALDHAISGLLHSRAEREGEPFTGPTLS